MDTHLTKNGKEFVIRRPNENDARSIINYSKTIFASTNQILTTLEEYNITVKDEKIWINNSYKNPSSIILIAEINKKVVGLLHFASLPKKKNSHTGEFGVSVHPDYQGIGIGRALVETLLKWAKDDNKIEKVFLNVFDTNLKAIKLYKDLGFVEEGRHIKAAKQSSGEYVDIIQMYIETK